MYLPVSVGCYVKASCHPYGRVLAQLAGFTFGGLVSDVATFLAASHVTVVKRLIFCPANDVDKLCMSVLIGGKCLHWLPAFQ